MGLYALAFAGMTPLGSLLIGTLAQHLGVRAACLIGGGLGLLAVGGLVVHGRRVGLRWGVHPPTARLAHAVADRSRPR